MAAAPDLDARPGPGRDAANSRAFPEGVPVLVETTTGVTLRAHRNGDVPAMVEQCRDPASIRWTTVPTPDGGYRVADAEEFLGVVAAGWRSGQRLSWVIEDKSRPGAYCGSIDLRLEGDGLAEVGYGLHPAARGRHLMSTALRMVCDYAFEVAGLQLVRWRAVVGNWPSRRVAASAGFRVEGTVRGLLVHRGERLDGWVGTLAAADPRRPLGWADPPVLRDGRLQLRPFVDSDADRIVAACSDARTQHWLISLPRPYGVADALDYIAGTRELAAKESGLVWCVADATTGECLGSVSLEGLGGYARRGEIGYWSHPAARGRGVITDAVRLVTAYAEERTRLDSVLIRAAAGNAASRHVAEAASYREVGVLRAAEPVGDSTLDDLVLYARP